MIFFNDQIRIWKPVMPLLSLPQIKVNGGGGSSVMLWGFISSSWTKMLVRVDWKLDEVKYKLQKRLQRKLTLQNDKNHENTSIALILKGLYQAT